jgi:hypothetical protein
VSLVDELLMAHPPVGWYNDLFYRYDTLFDGITLTTVVSAEQLDVGELPADALPVVSNVPNEVLAASGFEVEVELRGSPGLLLRGPEGWLRSCQAGDVVGLGFDRHQLRLEPRVASPSVEDVGDVVDAVRAAFARQGSAGKGPREGLFGRGGMTELVEVVTDALLADPTPWRRVLPPFDEVVEAAGLSRFGAHVAEADFDWHAQRTLGLMFALRPMYQLTEQQVGAVVRVDEGFQAFKLRGEEALGRAAGAEANGEIRGTGVTIGEQLAIDLCEGNAAPAAFDVLTDTGAPVGDLKAFASAVADRASRDRHRTGALWLAARCDLAAGHPVEAEESFRRIVASDSRYHPALADLGWLQFDRSSFAEARKLLNETSSGSEVVRELLDNYLQPTDAPVGRNEPCPCGVGKKFKRCHGSGAAMPPLDDRAAALVAKAMRLATTSDSNPLGSFIEVPTTWPATSRSEGRDLLRRLGEAGLTVDVALFENGWLQRYLDVRGELLPADERSLAQQWTAEPFRLLQATTDIVNNQFTAVDLADGAERTIRSDSSQPVVAAGQHLIARLLPSGTGNWLLLHHQAVPVGADSVDDALDLVTNHSNGMALARRFLAPPQREASAPVICFGVLDGDDATHLRSWLDTATTIETTWVDGPAGAGSCEVGATTLPISGRPLAMLHCGERLTVITQGLDTYQHVLASAAGLTKPLRPVVEGGVELGVLTEEAYWIEPDADQHGMLTETMLELVLVDAGIDVNPFDLSDLADTLMINA